MFTAFGLCSLLHKPSRTRPVDTLPQQGVCCCHATPTWVPSPMRKFGNFHVFDLTDAEKFRLNLVGRGVKGALFSLKKWSNTGKNWVRTVLVRRCERRKKFPMRREVRRSIRIDRSCIKHSRERMCPSLRGRTDRVARSETDRARGKFPRASNEVRDRSERSKIVRRSCDVELAIER